MKKTLRILLICLAFVLCLTPALIACDKPQEPADSTEEGGSSNNAEEVYEGTRIGKSENVGKTKTLILYQLAEPDATTGNTKCSLVLYDAENNVLNYMIFEYVGGGNAPNLLALKNTVWYDENCLVKVANADGTEQSFEIAYSK